MNEVYNIYYGETKINNNPVTKKEIDEIYSKEYIYKILNNQKQKIKTKDIFVRKCIVI